MPTDVEIDWKRVERHMEYFAGDFYPYIYAGMRRGFFRYLALFNKGAHIPGEPLPKRGGRHGMRALKPNQRGTSPHAFRLTLEPKNEKKGRIEDIRIEFGTTSRVAQAWEEGAKMTPQRGRWIAIPATGTNLNRTASKRVKRTWRTPTQARKRGWSLFYIGRFGGRGPFLAVNANQKKRRSRRGRPKKGEHRERIEPDIQVVFILVPRVVLEARLGFYDGWDRFRSERDKRVAQEFARYLREVWGQS